MATHSDVRPTDASAYYSISEAAARLGVSRATIWRWTRSGALPVSRLGHRTARISHVDLMRLLAREGGIGPSPGRSWPSDGVESATSAASLARATSAVEDEAEHTVQFYEADAALLDSLRVYVGEAIRSGDVAILIATEPHQRELEALLLADGLDLATARAQGQYIDMDAAATLERLMANGEPSQERFSQSIGGLMARATAGGRRVRVFGEMVALLAAAGDHRGALRLEALWNGLRRQYPFALLCAYPIGRSGGADAAGLVEDACLAHSRVIPAESFTSIADPHDRLRAIAVLQQKAAALEVELARRRQAEAHLRALGAATGQNPSFPISAVGRTGKEPLSPIQVEQALQAISKQATQISDLLDTLLKGVAAC